MNPFAFFLAIADKVHTALNLLDPTRTYAAADTLWAQQRGAGRGRCAELLEEIRDLLQQNGGRGDGKDVGECAESSSGAVRVKSPSSPPRSRPAGCGPRCKSMSPNGLLQCRYHGEHPGRQHMSESRGGAAAVWNDHEASVAPASQTDAPGEASGVPEGVSTPDPDAPSGYLNEFPWCLALTPNKLFMCRRAVGHTGLHRDTTEWSDPEK
jgi:hypothetical protein